MSNYVDRIVKVIECRKIESGTHPVHATVLEIKQELINELEKEISELESKGVIKVGQTINDRFVKLIEKYD